MNISNAEFVAELKRMGIWEQKGIPMLFSGRKAIWREGEEIRFLSADSFGPAELIATLRYGVLEVHGEESEGRNVDHVTLLCAHAKCFSFERIHWSAPGAGEVICNPDDVVNMMVKNALEQAPPISSTIQ